MKRADWPSWIDYVTFGFSTVPVVGIGAPVGSLLFYWDFEDEGSLKDAKIGFLLQIIATIIFLLYQVY